MWGELQGGERKKKGRRATNEFSFRSFLLLSQVFLFFQFYLTSARSSHLHGTLAASCIRPITLLLVEFSDRTA